MNLQIHQTSRVGKLFLGIALLCLILFGFFGIGRNEFSLPRNFHAGILYTAGICWNHGLDPYEYKQLHEVGKAVGYFDVSEAQFPYPPASSLLCMFLGLFSPEMACVVMAILNLLAITCLIYFTLKLLKGTKNSPLNWFIPAIIIGNPFTADVVWLGQVTLIVAAAIVGGWVLIQQNNILGGILIGIATIQLELSLLVVFWLVLEKRLWILLTILITVLALSWIPLLQDGVFMMIREWAMAVGREMRMDKSTYQHVFGLKSVVAVYGWSLPTHPFLIGMFITFILWLFHSWVLSENILAFLLPISLCLIHSHDYEMAVLTPLLAAFCNHLKSLTSISISLIALALLFIPQNLFDYGYPSLLLHYREILLLLLTGWLFVMSIQKRRQNTRDRRQEKFS